MWGAALYVSGCLAPSLASAQKMPVHHLITKNVPRYCQMSERRGVTLLFHENPHSLALVQGASNSALRRWRGEAVQGVRGTGRLQEGWWR